MNLLNVLLKVMLADAALKALSGKTGLNTSSLKKLLPLAIPLLLRYMTKNASTQSGALSLLGALTQHTNARSMDEMFAEADEVDGGKIVQHILGDDSGRAIQSLAAETGMSTADVSRALGGLAPALLSVLSSATSTASSQSAANQSAGLDLSDLLGLFGGASAQQTSNSSLLGSLLGGSSAQQQSGAGLGLLDALLGVTPTEQPVQQPVQQQSGGLLSSLFGLGSTQQQPVQQPVQQQGGGLLSSLFGLGSTQQQPVQQQSGSGLGLLDTLLGVTPTTQQVQQPVQQQSGGLLSSLLGLSSTAQQPVQQQSLNNVNGTNLLSLLLGAMQ